MEELGRLTPEQQQTAERHRIIIILDDVRSMQNVGSIFRTCDAFAAEALYLCGYTPQPPHRDIHKTALGATETVPWQHYTTVEEAITAAKEKGYRILAVEQAHGSIPLQQVQQRERIALILGNEVTGVSDAGLNMADGCVEIPQWGAKHSLNVSVTAGVALWEMVRDRV